MAARPLGVWGIDLGQCALKAIRLEMKDGQVVATAFEYIEHPKILSQPDADPDELTREALNQFLERNKIKGDFVCISVPGQSGLARFVKLPPVDEKKIADIVRFEAKQQIPFPLEEVVWDFQRLNRGDIVDGMALETEIGLFAIKRDMVNRAIHQFKDVGVEVQVVQMAPLALNNFVSYDLLGKGTGGADEAEEERACIVCLEIGTDASNLVITDGGRIIWQRPIPIGGNHFTRALTKEMKLTFAKAEHLKRNAAKSPDLKKILSSLKQVLNDFVGEVQRSLGYFTNTHRNAQIQYMVGLGNAFRLPGLQKFLQEKLQLEVRKLQKFERASGESVTTAPTFADNIMSFGVAYGLALQGLQQARLQTNLLPHEVRLERLIRGKKPWAVAAAACLMFGMCVLAFAQGMERSAIVNEETTNASKELDKKVKEASDADKKFMAEADKVKKTLGVLDDLGAGVNDRLHWQLLHQYVNMASPQPDGTRMAENSERGDRPRFDYYENDKAAQEANVLLQEKKFKPQQLDADKAAARDLFIKKHLIQINIIGINAVYSDDLGSYFKAIYSKKKGAEMLGMHQAEREKIKAFAEQGKDSGLPKDGWVVEIRGYTYHSKTFNFLSNTIIENLKFPGKLEDPKDPKTIMSKELREQVEKRVGYLLIYHWNKVDNPTAGQFEGIGKGNLRELVKNTGGGGGGEKPPPPDKKGPGIKPAGKPAGGGGGGNRDGWSPVGDMASSIYGGGGGGGGGPREMIPRPDVNPKGPDPKGIDPKGVDPKSAAAQIVPRTEFTLLFIWQEPPPVQHIISLSEKKN